MFLFIVQTISRTDFSFFLFYNLHQFMDCVNPAHSREIESSYEVLIKVASSVPISGYLLIFSSILILFLYNFLEIHFLQDLLSGFRGQPVVLTFNSSSRVYDEVVSKCKILHGRYLSTPWLSSPHLQTLFLHFLGNPPAVNYRRQIFMASDGGTMALDWVVVNGQGKKPFIQGNDVVQQDDKSPIIVIIPGLTSDSNSSYIRHLAFEMAKRGLNVVVSNHRGLGGVSITSDRFYNAGWTEDVRKVIDYLHSQYPGAPLFAIGTSIGANILVKYLAEDGVNVPITGAAAICSPWDLLICDRFMNRRLVQRLYNKALALGLKDYAELHEAVLSRLSNWEGVKKSRSVRDFDDSATRVLGNYETVDTYYRRCSSSNYVGGVTIPLLCISSLDDPVCTSEAIPWDECRLNPNVVLATTEHGGHLPFFEGLTAKRVWWVRAVDEFFYILQYSSLSHRNKKISVSCANPLESSIDHAPYVHVSDSGMIAAMSDEVTQHQNNNMGAEESVSLEQNADEEINIVQTTGVRGSSSERDNIGQVVEPVKKSLNQLMRQNRKSLWLLAYIAVITTWPVVGSALTVFFRSRFKHFFSRAPPKR